MGLPTLPFRTVGQHYAMYESPRVGGQHLIDDAFTGNHIMLSNSSEREGPLVRYTYLKRVCS